MYDPLDQNTLDFESFLFSKTNKINNIHFTPSNNGCKYLNQRIHDTLTNRSELLADEVNDDSVTHQTLIGFFALNNLKDVIPNFAYVYAMWDGTALLETVKDGVRLREEIYNMSSCEFLEVLFQILFAMKMANDEYLFSHGDLSVDNILIRRAVDGEVQSRYDGMCVKSTIIPVITNYSKSHVYIEVDGVEGDYGFVEGSEMEDMDGEEYLRRDLRRLFESVLELDGIDDGVREIVVMGLDGLDDGDGVDALIDRLRNEYECGFMDEEGFECGEVNCGMIEL